MANEQRILRFKGNVQGVGFRYTACRTADRYDVGGYVRNEPDGSVECVVEGQADEIREFVNDLTDRMSRYIRETQQQTAPYAGRYAGFNVKY